MTITVGIQNSPNGLNLVGTVTVTVSASPAPVRIEYYLDNTLMYAPSTLVTSWAWNTTKEANGTHVVRVEAVYKSRRSKAQITVSTANPVSGAGTFGAGSFGSGTFGGTVSLLFRRLQNRIAGFFGRAPKNM